MTELPTASGLAAAACTDEDAELVLFEPATPALSDCEPPGWWSSDCALAGWLAGCCGCEVTAVGTPFGRGSKGSQSASAQRASAAAAAAVKSAGLRHVRHSSLSSMSSCNNTLAHYHNP